MIRGYKTNIKHEYTKTKFGRSVNIFWHHDTCGCGRLKQKVSPHCRWCCFNKYFCISKGIDPTERKSLSHNERVKLSDLEILKRKEYRKRIKEKKKARLLKIELRKKSIQQRVNKFSRRRLKIIEYLKSGKYTQNSIAKKFSVDQSRVSAINIKYVKQSKTN